jgi:hypothetical protein
MILRYQRNELERQRCCMFRQADVGRSGGVPASKQCRCASPERWMHSSLTAVCVPTNIPRRKSRDFSSVPPVLRARSTGCRGQVCIVDTPASRSHAGRQSANQNGSPRPLAFCSSVTLATMFRFLVLHVFERKAACLPPSFCACSGGCRSPAFSQGHKVLGQTRDMLQVPRRLALALSMSEQVRL